MTTGVNSIARRTRRARLEDGRLAGLEPARAARSRIGLAVMERAWTDVRSRGNTQRREAAFSTGADGGVNACV